MKQLTEDIFNQWCDIIEDDTTLEIIRLKIKKGIDNSPDSVIFDDAVKQVNDITI